MRNEEIDTHTHSKSKPSTLKEILADIAIEYAARMVLFGILPPPYTLDANRANPIDDTTHLIRASCRFRQSFSAGSRSARPFLWAATDRSPRVGLICSLETCNINMSSMSFIGLANG